jgi:hypothetical protein
MRDRDRAKANSECRDKKNDRRPKKASFVFAQNMIQKTKLTEA